MATSSITTNFIISGKRQVEAFANAVEASAQKSSSINFVSAKRLSSPDDIKSLMAKRKK